MENAAGLTIAELRVDGGASVMDGLCQFQSDLLAMPVLRASNAEATARGAALLAALGVGLISSPYEAAQMWAAGTRFEPARPGMRPVEEYAAWQKAVDRVFS
jgi:glycerol kinase